MSNTGRFQFPGFFYGKDLDTSTHEVELGAIKSDGALFCLTLIRNKDFPDLPFVIANIEDADENRIWDFKRENFDGVGLLADASGCIVVALVGRGKEGKVERVIPFYNFTSGTPERDLRRLIDLKMRAAGFLGRKYNLSASENAIKKIDIKREVEEADRRKLAEQAQRQTERKERLDRIMARGKVEGYTTSGRKMFGLPVLDSEWPMLPSGTYVILVNSVNDKTGDVGTMIEAFQVEKRRGKNPKKGNLFAVSAKSLVAPKVSTILPVGQTIIEHEGGAFEVQLYKSMDDIRTARAEGLNSGTHVAVEGKDAAGKIEVFAAHHDKLDTVGKFAPLE